MPVSSSPPPPADGHPGVADAVASQLRLHNTNSRFLYGPLPALATELAAMGAAAGVGADPSGADTVVFMVVSGGEGGGQRVP